MYCFENKRFEIFTSKDVLKLDVLQPDVLKTWRFVGVPSLWVRCVCGRCTWRGRRSRGACTSGRPTRAAPSPPSSSWTTTPTTSRTYSSGSMPSPAATATVSSRWVFVFYVFNKAASKEDLKTQSVSRYFLPVLRIHDILAWIRIRICGIDASD